MCYLLTRDSIGIAFAHTDKLKLRDAFELKFPEYLVYARALNLKLTLLSMPRGSSGPRV